MRWRMTRTPWANFAHWFVWELEVGRNHVCSSFCQRNAIA
jgi:hypothetical protein